MTKTPSVTPIAPTKEDAATAKMSSKDKSKTTGEKGTESSDSKAKKRAPRKSAAAAASARSTRGNATKPSAVAARNKVKVITKLRPQDVLLGRGTGPSCYVGNKAFRVIVDERKEEYVSNSQYKKKSIIGEEVYEKVIASGGRFLKQLEPRDRGYTKEELTEDDEKWVEADKKTAIEKCKQALRELRPGDPRKADPSRPKRKGPRKSGNPAGYGAPTMWSPAAYGGYPMQSLSGYLHQFGLSAPPPNNMAPLAMPTMQRGYSGHPVDSHLRLYQPMPYPPTPLAQWTQQHPQQQQQVPINNPNVTLMPLASGSRVASQAHFRGLPPPKRPNGGHSLYPPDNERPLHGPSTAGPPGSVPVSYHHTAPTSSPPTTTANYFGDSHGFTASLDSGTMSPDSSNSDRDEAVFALSILSLADRPRFTEEEEALEKESLTDEERAAILADIFGKLNEGVRHKNKKARRDLDPASIDFLITHMRHEIDKIPQNEKMALMEAQVKANADEFSDKRLERFLRCDAMNATLAAHRFVKYWEARRAVFGEEKYVMKMTLSEAVKDDVTAIEAAVYFLLPHKDLSGRQLVYLEPHRHTRQGYTSESMLRAFWYTMEVLSQTNTDIGSGFVHVVWDKFSTLGDFDRHVWDGYLRYMTTAWPIKSVAIHSCCTPPLVVQIIKPILFALTSKSVRSRLMFHGPESMLLDSLSEYGILRSMLPTNMGGDIELNPVEWVEQRRAAELEEL